MKVKNLIKLLEKYPDDTLVVLSSDAEGNNYSPLSDVFEGKYIKETSWSGSMLPLDDPDLEEEDYEGSVDAICLSPIN